MNWKEIKYQKDIVLVLPLINQCILAVRPIMDCA